MSKTANQWLSRFRLDVTSNANRVYANGRQQLAVTVTLAPRDGEVITDEQLDSLTLLEIDEDGRYRLLDDELVSSQERDPRFEYYAASGGAPQNLIDAGSDARRRTFHVSSTRAGGSLHSIYAGIYFDDQTSFVTDTGPFKSSIVVESITPRRYGAADFTLERHDAVDDGELDIDEYSLRFTDPNLRIVQTLAYGASGDHAFHYRLINNASWYNLGLATSYDRSLYAYEMGDEQEVFFGNQVALRINTRAGAMSLARVQRVRDNASFNLLGSTPAFSRESIWGLVDQYGNEHTVKFHDQDDGNGIGFSMHP